MWNKIRTLLIISITAFIVWMIMASSLTFLQTENESPPYPYSGYPWWKIILLNTERLYLKTLRGFGELPYPEMILQFIIGLFIGLTIVYPIFCKLIFRVDLIKSRIWLYWLILIGISLGIPLLMSTLPYYPIIVYITIVLTPVAYIYMFVKSILLIKRYKSKQT